MLKIITKRTQFNGFHLTIIMAPTRGFNFRQTVPDTLYYSRLSMSENGTLTPNNT